jgi:hypothetical protein
VANINDAFPSNYLKASDLAGQQPTVTIDRVEFEAVGREKEMKPVIYFAGKDKGMVLNKTNAKNIAGLIGSFETGDWSGTRIRLYATHVEFNGETVETIRVKAAPPNGNGRAVAPPPPAPVADTISDEDIPF